MQSEETYPRVKDSDFTGYAGVTLVQRFFDQAKWLFREQPLKDVGIDAHVEVVEGEYAKGRLVALQIKSGDSHLNPVASGGWVFYPKAEHVNYWLNHSLPVAIIVWQESTNKIFFREVSQSTLEKTEGGIGWKLQFDDTNILGPSALATLKRLSEGTTYDLRLRQLRLLLPWMERLQRGERLLLSVEEWVNKMDGRGSLQIDSELPSGKTVRIGNWGVRVGGKPYAEVLPGLFDWATLKQNPDVEDTYDDRLLHYPEGAVRPYRTRAGEVDDWSLELHLNDVGRAILALENYASQPEQSQLQIDD